MSFSIGCTKWNTAANKSLLLFKAGLFIGFLVEKCVACQSRKADCGWHRFRFSPCYCFLSLAHSFHFFSPRYSIKDCQLLSLVHFVAMSRVANNNRGFLQLLADCPAHQRHIRMLYLTRPDQMSLTKQRSESLYKRVVPFFWRFVGPCCFKLRISDAIKVVTHRTVDHSKLRLPPLLIKMKREIDLIEEENESEHKESEDEEPTIH